MNTGFSGTELPKFSHDFESSSLWPLRYASIWQISCCQLCRSVYTKNQLC